MPSWATWVLVGVLLWFVVSVLVGLIVGAMIRFGAGGVDRAERAKALRTAASRRSRKPTPITAVAAPEPERERVLVVDDDPGLRLLLRTTLPASEFDVEEADSAETAAETREVLSPGSRHPRRHPPGEGRAHVLPRAQAVRRARPT